MADQQHEVPANQQDQAAADQQDRVVGERRSSSSSTDVTAEKERLLANRDQQDQAATDQQDQATTDQQDEAAADQQDDTPALDRFLSSTSFTTEKESLLAKQNQDPSKPDDDEFADLVRSSPLFFGRLLTIFGNGLAYRLDIGDRVCKFDVRHSTMLFPLDS